MGSPFWNALNSVSVDVIVAFAGFFLGAVSALAVFGRVERRRQTAAAGRRRELANARREGARLALRDASTKRDDQTPPEKGGRP